MLVRSRFCYYCRGEGSMRVSTRKLEQAAATERDPRWASVLARSPAADGSFFYSVRTTGVYCRPSCAARVARPENVRFHGTRQEAEQPGFRPCRRCKPDQPSLSDQHAAMVTEACRLIETSEGIPSLEALATHAGMSVFHFHRIFKAVMGLTPREYATARRGERIRGELTRGRTVTSAIYESGYSSNAQFYGESRQVLGMSPSIYRTGGANADIRFAVGECSLGSILVARSEIGVCAILLGDDPDALVRDLQDRFPRATIIGGDTGFEELVSRVVGFIETPGLGLNLPLDVRGTAFQQRVWQALQDIPVGSTASYTEIAARIGAPKSVRAVARACAANPLAVAIPCHRVVRNDGALAGYRWGVDRKAKLLNNERDATE